MRVVQDASTANTNRRGDAAAATGVAARAGAGVGAANAASASSAGTKGAIEAKKGLPMLQAAIFLLACVVGGAAVALLRPF